LLEDHGNGPALGLSAVEGGILGARAVEIVEEAIVVEELHRPSHGHHHHARNVDALLLIHLHGLGGRLRARAGRRALHRDRRPAAGARRRLGSAAPVRPSAGYRLCWHAWRARAWRRWPE